jgi:hypothetical protein
VRGVGGLDAEAFEECSTLPNEGHPDGGLIECQCDRHRACLTGKQCVADATGDPWKTRRCLRRPCDGAQTDDLRAEWEEYLEQTSRPVEIVLELVEKFDLDPKTELWIDSLGLPAVLPPPEEEKDVKTAIGAARAKKTRRSLL